MSEIIFDINNQHHKRERYVKKYLPILYNNVCDFNLNKEILFSQQLYNYLNNLKEIPKCQTCKVNDVLFINFNVGYQKFCSTKCSSDNSTVKLKRSKTNIKKYGFSCVLQNNEIKNKIKKTNIIKYGFDNPSKNINVINKIKNVRNKNVLDDWSIKLNKPNLIIKKLDNDNLEIFNYCDKHESFIIKRQTLYGRYYRQGLSNLCTKCIKLNENISNIEIEIFNYIKNDLNIKCEKYIIENKEIDIYLPDFKLGIEFDGIYYHSNKFKDKNYHLNKTNLCEQRDIQLLHIFENEWVNKKEIIKSIIKSKLSIFNNKILANECMIKEIDSITASNFLNTNHIQGNINSKVKIGLFYNDDLVSVMTFGKKRTAIINKIGFDDEYKIYRFCNKINTQVIDGASKLLNYFIKTYKPKSIIILVDRRYSQGNLYKQLGFKFIENIKPNYWYFHINNTLKKYYRFKFSKDILIKQGFDLKKTKKEMMYSNGYIHIYDSGSKKYKLELNNNSNLK